jgi:hypothetical protein
MKISRMIGGGFSLLLLLPSSIAVAQEFTLTEAMSGSKMPLSMKPGDIPDDFRAVKIITSGSGGGLMNDLFGGSTLPMLMSMGGNTMQAPAQMFFEILPVTWTRGEVVKIVGQDYVVTYAFEPGPIAMKSLGASGKIPEFALKLKLVKTSELGSITPLAEWSKERYLRAVGQLVGTPRVAKANRPSTEKVAIATPQPIERPTLPVTQPTNTEKVAVKTPDTTLPVDTKPVAIPPTSVAVNTELTPTAVKGAAVSRTGDQAAAQLGLVNAKNIAAGMLLYAQDYDSTFPYVQGSRAAFYVIFPYVKGTNAYKTYNPMHPSDFRFNMALAGVPMTAIQNPTETPLFYDPFQWPDGTYLVSFADSHARFVSYEEWQNLKKNLALKLKRVGNPLPVSYGLPTATPDTSGSGGGNR